MTATLLLDKSKVNVTKLKEAANVFIAGIDFKKLEYLNHTLLN